jgi:serine/threonine-protein kinase RsbW
MNVAAQPVVLDLPSEAAVLGVVRAALRALAADVQRVRLESRELDEVQVALHEACTNSIRHAHKSDPTKRLRVELHRLENSLEIVIRDRGEPFDLDARPVAAPESLQEGGYGISIMRSWMDQVVLTRDADGNVLRMVRHYRTLAGAGHDAAR